MEMGSSFLAGSVFLPLGRKAFDRKERDGGATDAKENLKTQRSRRSAAEDAETIGVKIVD
jgi:hypothetical protein